MKFLCISDTHGKHRLLECDKADGIIHAGDFSHGEKSFYEFLEWFGCLDYKYKILIAGNHDGYIVREREAALQAFNLYGIIYLEDSSIEIEGIKIYGSPWSVEFCGWDFMKEDLELEEVWDKIDEDVDILITHTPPAGILDRTSEGILAGSYTLKRRIEKLKKLKYHIFGHIHEAKGREVIDEVCYINAVSVNKWFMVLSPEEIEI